MRPQFVHGLMQKLLLQLVAELQKLGATVVHADPATLILSTGKRNLTAAIGWVLLCALKRLASPPLERGFRLASPGAWFLPARPGQLQAAPFEGQLGSQAPCTAARCTAVPSARHPASIGGQPAPCHPSWPCMHAFATPMALKSRNSARLPAAAPTHTALATTAARPAKCSVTTHPLQPNTIQPRTESKQPTKPNPASLHPPLQLHRLPARHPGQARAVPVARPHARPLLAHAAAPRQVRCAAPRCALLRRPTRLLAMEARLACAGRKAAVPRPSCVRVSSCPCRGAGAQPKTC